MLTYIGFCQLFLLTVDGVLEQNYIIDKQDIENKETEAIFTDVIKNISRVNNILEELISNYERLQEIYKSQENIEKDYSSDSEVDEVYKHSRPKLGKKDNDSYKHTEHTTKKLKEDIFLSVTEMIWSEEKTEDHTDLSDDDDKSKIKLNRVPEIEGKQQDKNHELDKRPNLKESNESQEVVLKEKQLRKETQRDIVNKPVDTEIVFIDTHKQKAKYHRKKKTKKSNVQFDVVTDIAKTRHSKILRSKELKPDKYLSQNNKTKNIRKVVYAETFSPDNIWNEIMNNKPLKLKPEEEITYNMNQRAKDNPLDVNLRTKTAKTALVIVIKNNKRDQRNKRNSSLEDEDLINREEFKTQILRKAYGDACLKVVVRKCFKACKSVGKMVCRRFKCKRAFKDKFKEHSKTGCVREFHTIPSNNFSIYNRNNDNEHGLIDITRGGYLSAACLPSYKHDRSSSILRNKTRISTTLVQENNLNILRDRFERACQKVSTKKCQTACDFAYSQTCTSYECKKAQKKAFKRDCKRQCKIAFKGASKSKDSSDSESEESDSDSMSVDSKE